jgi:serine protease Do
MSFGPLDETARRRYGVPADVRGVVVESVSGASGAGQKGLRRGAVILRAGDKEVTSPADVPAAVDAAKRAGRTSILLQVRQGGRNLFVAVKIAP